MLTLVTGTPGSFKTTYTVWELLRSIPGSTLETADGSTVERKLYSNINGLLLDHEPIDADNLRNWHTWAKPGAVICFDEVQHVWRPRSLGVKVPDEIQALETHRHMGVDIILVTQHPMLLDSNIRRLVNRHLHLRRLATGATWVYEWDHCSNPHQTKSCITSGLWVRRKEAFKLFTSAQAHTKPVTKIPMVAYLAIPALAAAGYFGWYSYSSISNRAENALAAAAPAGPLIVDGGDLVREVPASAPESAMVAPAAAGGAGPLGPASGPPDEAFAGCARARDVCNCYSSSGMKAERPPEVCDDLTLPGPVQLGLVEPVRDIDAGVDVTAPIPSGGPDLDLVRWVNRGRQRPSVEMW